MMQFCCYLNIPSCESREKIAVSDENSTVEESNIEDNNEAENDEETNDEDVIENDKGKIGCHIIMMPKHSKIRWCTKAA